MKVVVTSTGTNLDAEVDPRFGRCAYFVVVETNDMSFRALTNPSVAAGGGAGISAGQLMADEGVEAVLTGSVGPNAFRTLEAAGIQVITGASGTVREAVEQYVSGRMSATSNATVPGHFGLAAAADSTDPPANEPARDNPMPPSRPGRGGGRGRRGGGGMGLGPGGNCVCPQCGKVVAHRPGTPCSQMKCPACGSLMMRE